MAHSGAAARHQPINWRDSIGLQTIGTPRGVPKARRLTQRLVPYSENKGYASNPRRFLLNE